MKILQIHNSYIFKGGEDTVVEQERNLLVENGHEVFQLKKKNKEEIINFIDKLKVAKNLSYSTEGKVIYLEMETMEKKIIKKYLPEYDYKFILKESNVKFVNFKSDHELELNGFIKAGDNFDPSSSHVIPALILKIFNAKKNNLDQIEVWGDGSPTRDFLFVDDAAKGIVQAAEKYDEIPPLNLGSSEEISIKKLVQPKLFR